MVIRNHEVLALVSLSLLVFEHIGNGAQIVADVQIASGLHSGQQNLALAEHIHVAYASHLFLISDYCYGGATGQSQEGRAEVQVL